MNKTEFFEKYGHRLVKVHEDDPETGDYQLFAPEESDIALDYYLQGYDVASVFKNKSGKDTVKIDNTIILTKSNSNKIGYLILTKKNKIVS